MQINKKIFTTAITALLLLSILAATAPAFAITTAPVLYVPATTPVTVILPATPQVVGAKIEVVGTAGQAANFANVTVYWDTPAGAVLGSALAAANGAYAINVTIPSAAYGAHLIVVNDGAFAQSADIAIKPSLSAGIGTVRAMPGDSVTLTGKGYAPLSAITLTFTGGTFVAPAITTDATGSFTVAIVIPLDTGLSTVAYTATAVDAIGGLHTASASITVSHYVTVTPSGLGTVLPAGVPPGVTVTIAGRITVSTPFTITIDAVTVATGTSGADGRFSTTYVLPTLIGAATHTVNVVAAGLTPVAPTTNLYVGGAPQIQMENLASAIIAGATIGQTIRVVSVTPALGPPVIGAFDPLANITLTLGSVVVNSTATDSRFGPAAVLTGLVDAQFAVPNIAPGLYTVTLTDQYGATASTTLIISAAAATTILPNFTTYVQGETISYNITSTDAAFAIPTFTLMDPSNSLIFIGQVMAVTTLPSTVKVVPFADQVDAHGNHFTLATNAPTGIWNWTITYTNIIGANQKATGLFTVNAAGTSGGVSNADLNTTLATINTKLNTLNVTVNGLTTSISALGTTVTSIQGTVASLSTSMGQVTTSVNSLSASISSISSGVATIQTSLGTVTTSLTSIDAVLGAVAGDTATIKTSVGDLTTSLTSIGTTVTSISGNVATIQTDLGTLKGTVTSVSGNVATIQTSIGTMQADISTLKADVTSTKDSTSSLSTLIIVAIVLALLAAIAAIASIVLMRRKIAG